MNGRTRPVPIDWKTTVEMSSLPSRGRSCQNEDSRSGDGAGLVELTGAVCRAAPTSVARLSGRSARAGEQVGRRWPRCAVRGGAICHVAEDGGFEPPRVLSQHDFQSCALGHYANPPRVRLLEGEPPTEIVALASRGCHDLRMGNEEPRRDAGAAPTAPDGRPNGPASGSTAHDTIAVAPTPPPTGSVL